MGFYNIPIVLAFMVAILGGLFSKQGKSVLMNKLSIMAQGLADKKEIDQAITDILTTTDEEERQELYRFVLTRLHEDAVYIPLTFECNKALYTKNLQGVHFGTDSMMFRFLTCILNNQEKPFLLRSGFLKDKT